ncbi:unnamed protein product [Rhodiola kirilowii]
MPMTIKDYQVVGLGCMFSSSILLQILVLIYFSNHEFCSCYYDAFSCKACVLYSNLWPMITALMYVLVPMPDIVFFGGSSRDGGGGISCAKLLTGVSAVGNVAIPIILRLAGLIGTEVMFIEFASFFILVFTVFCFHIAILEDDWVIEKRDNYLVG